MRKNRKALYLHSTIIRGRRLREGEEDGGGTGESGTQPNNTGVNGESAPGGQQSNAGQPFDPASFWASDGNDDAGDDSNNDGSDEGKELGTQLVSQIQAFKPKADVFTAEALEKMASGDLTPLNEAIAESHRAGMTQMLGITAQLLKRFETHIEGRFESLVGKRLNESQTNQRDERVLSENFKGYADPAVKPVIQGVWNQALRHTKGDRKAALTMTQGMLQAMGKAGKDDMGFSNFRNPDDNLDEGPSRLVQELLELKRP